MNKLIFIILIALIGIYCGNKKNTNPIKSITLENRTKKLKYLLSANGGSIGYFDDGSVVGCPRCDFDENVEESLLHLEVIANYTIYPTYLFVKYPDYESKEFFFDEYGSVNDDWKIINYQRIEFNKSVATFVSRAISEDSIQDITSTCMIEMPLEIKHFENEESDEAQTYFTVMDDLLYYVHNTRERLSEKGIQSIIPTKQYLRFTLSDGTKIIIDSGANLNGINVSALLYKKGELPLILDIVDGDVELENDYLQNKK